MDQSQNECQCGLENPLSQESNRIIGGSFTKPNQYPWQVLFQMKWDRDPINPECNTPKGQLCLPRQSLGAGSIISPSYILTCAHNVAWFKEDKTFGIADTNSVWLYIGAHVHWADTDGLPLSPVAGKDLIEEFIVHEDYGKEDNFYGTNPPFKDIALVKLISPLRYSHTIRPICLPASTSTLYKRKWAKVIGWGGTTSMYSFLNAISISTVSCPSGSVSVATHS